MKIQVVKLLFATTFFLLINGSLGYGSTDVSISAIRESLADDEFAFSFKEDGVKANFSGIVAYSLAAPRNRLLGMSDVNVNLILVKQQPGHVIPWHVHPRGGENYATISGTIEVSMTLEGLRKPRKIVSELPPAHAFAIPQGYPHSVKCVSHKPCVYHIFFNAADAGIAFLSM